MNIFHIVGARPNFMKVAPVLNALKEREAVAQTLIHTGQHYDVNMSDVFFHCRPRIKKSGNKKKRVERSPPDISFDGMIEITKLVHFSLAAMNIPAS